MDIETYKKTFDYIVDRITNKNNSEVPSEISLEYYTFCENFTKYLGVSQYSELSDYRNQVLEYLDKTFPYSFMKIDNKNVEDAIKLYVTSLGFSQDKVPFIILKLHSIKMKHIDKKNIRYLLEQEQMQVLDESIQLDNIVGTSVSKYQNDNLYDILKNINDKNINSYISYLINNNVFDDELHFQKVFSGISITKDQNNNQYINEGNHRIFTYIALLTIRDFLNIPTKSKTFNVNATVYKPKVLKNKR